LQCAYECAVCKLLQTSVIIYQNNYRAVSCSSSHTKHSSSQYKEPHLCGEWIGNFPEFATICHVKPLCKMPNPTTTCLNCILHTLLMYQQHILSLHSLCLHHTTVAVYCILSQLHLHLPVVLDQYISMGQLHIMATAFCIKRQWIFLQMQH